MYQQANDWLRETEVTVKYRYNRSLTWLLSANGFARGPLRQLYNEHSIGAVPFFKGYNNVFIVHTRHPVEMMVSAYNCIANSSVCPVRSKFLGTHVPKNDTVRSLDDFVLQGIVSLESGDKQQLAGFLAEAKRWEAGLNEADVVKAKAAGLELFRAAGVTDRAVLGLFT